MLRVKLNEAQMQKEFFPLRERSKRVSFAFEEKLELKWKEAPIFDFLL